MFGIARLNTLSAVVSTGGEFSTWDVSTASYASKSLSVRSQDGGPEGLFFKPDGTSFYISGNSTDSIKQYTMSTAWDLSTASYASKTFSVNSQGTNPLGLFFKSDGTIMYVIDNAVDKIHQYTLSTAWDVSTASYASKSFDVSGTNAFPLDLSFSTDGTKLYFVGSQIVWQCTLSTAWDVSTASYASKSFSVSSQEAACRAIFFNPSGQQLFVVGSFSDTVYQYTLSTAWDVSTASYASKSFSVSSQEDVSSGLFFKPDGTRMYIVGTSNDTVYQYTLT
jgi:sugar lactone lactonase YvrE